jgi:hypothetical protein
MLIMTLDDPAALHIRDRDVCSDPGSNAVFEIARGWLTSCLSQHRKCKGDRDAVLPTRIIDVSNPRKPKLHVSLSGQKDPYFALSYCWGTGSKDYVLTMARLTAMQHGFDLESLPQTLRDAITLTSRFEYRFIWIDALCIIQDSLEDWEHESARMCSIYSGAILTIGAAWATNASEGILRLRSNKHPTLRFINEDGAIGTAHLRPHPPSYYDAMQPLNSRGWTFQERRLAPRTLLYNSRHMTWECYTSSHKEEDADVYSGGPFKKPSVALFPRGRPDPCTEHMEREALLDGWVKILRDYSKRKFAVPSDKLPALAGVVASIQQELSYDNRCLAGIWYTLLPNVLMWRVTGEARTTRSKTFRAPSWSWASVDGPVHLYGYEFAGMYTESVNRIEWSKPLSIEMGTEQYMLVQARLLEVEIPQPGQRVRYHYVLNCQCRSMEGQLVREVYEDACVGCSNALLVLDWLPFPTHNMVFINGITPAGVTVRCNFDDYDDMVAYEQGSLRGLWCLMITDRAGLLIAPLEEENRWVRVGNYWSLKVPLNDGEVAECVLV